MDLTETDNRLENEQGKKLISQCCWKYLQETSFFTRIWKVLTIVWIRDPSLTLARPKLLLKYTLCIAWFVT